MKWSNTEMCKKYYNVSMMFLHLEIRSIKYKNLLLDNLSTALRSGSIELSQCVTLKILTLDKKMHIVERKVEEKIIVLVVLRDPTTLQAPL